MEKIKYPFGCGLSYTSFLCEVMFFQIKGEEVSLSIRVTNAGNKAGKEVVQVYYCPSQGVLGKPARNLIHFTKKVLLNPKEYTELSLSFFHQRSGI